MRCNECVVNKKEERSYIYSDSLDVLVSISWPRLSIGNIF